MPRGWPCCWWAAGAGANTRNIAADVAAMGEALQLIAGGLSHGHALLFGLACALLPVWLNYEAYGAC